MAGAGADPRYGYEGRLAAIRSQYHQLAGVTFLDHAGSTPSPGSLVREHAAEITGSLYSNPHSQHPSSQRSAIELRRAREAVLRHFGVDSSSHAVVFTAGATAACKLLGEAFHFEAGPSPRVYTPGEDLSGSGPDSDQGCALPELRRSSLCYLSHSHTSVVGLRERCIELGCTVSSLAEASVAECDPCSAPHDAAPWSLFAYPAQCNFSGRRYPLAWAGLLKQSRLRLGTHSTRGNRWRVLLDASALVSTCRLDLAACAADFVVLSFYKMFGFPTGLGALIVRRDSVACLRERPYFGGGAVSTYSSTHHTAVRHPSLEARLEDGSVSFLAIAAVRRGLQYLDSVGLEAVSDHTRALAEHTLAAMDALHHYNEASCVVVYRDRKEGTPHGPVVAFNLKRADGSFVGFREVEKLAAIHDIHLRGGCFCNVGACHFWLGITHEVYAQNVKAGLTCGDDRDLREGFPVGALRISFGLASTAEDAGRFVAFLEEFFVEAGPPKLAALERAEDTATAADDGSSDGELRCPKADAFDCDVAALAQICVYPVKSCRAMSVRSWPLGRNGLLYDREWLVVDHDGETLTQKLVPQLCLVRPTVDVESGVLELSFAGGGSCTVGSAPPSAGVDARMCPARVCGDSVKGQDCGDEVAAWLSARLDIACRLLRKSSARACKLSGGADLELSFSNEAQFLITSESSMTALNQLADPAGAGTATPVDRFRGNLVVSGNRAFAEDGWAFARVGGVLLRVHGLCKRCQMVCVDQATGLSSAEPLRSLAKHRRLKGKTYFGVHAGLTADPADPEAGQPARLTVGASVDVCLHP